MTGRSRIARPAMPANGFNEVEEYRQQTTPGAPTPSPSLIEKSDRRIDIPTFMRRLVR
jgi:hypothetical protein